jgi:hypothetical protein
MRGRLFSQHVLLINERISKKVISISRQSVGIYVSINRGRLSCE